MRLLPWCKIFLLWTIVSSAQVAIAEDSEIQSEPNNNQADAPESFALFVPSERSKRQQSEDATTAFVGLNVQRGAEAADYAQVKQIASRVRRNSPRSRRSLLIGKRRRKRPTHKKVLQKYPEPAIQIYHTEPVILEQSKPAEHHHHHHHHHHEKIYVPVPVAPTTTISAPPQILTETQETFNEINQNPTLSRNLREEFLREINKTIFAESDGDIDSARVQAANRLVVVREAGITCVDVCGKSEGEPVGYGTIGICTPKFCRCDFNFGTYTRMDCPVDMVFDPISLACNSPFNVVLCNDKEYQKPQKVKLIQPAVVVPKYILTTPVVTPVTALSLPISPEPNFLVNSLENSRVQTPASPTYASLTDVAPESTYPVTPAPPSFSATLSQMYDYPRKEPQATYPVSPAFSPLRTISTTFRPATHYSKIPSPTAATLSSQVKDVEQNRISKWTPTEFQPLNKFVAADALPPDHEYSSRLNLRSSQYHLQKTLNYINLLFQKIILLGLEDNDTPWGFDCRMWK